MVLTYAALGRDNPQRTARLRIALCRTDALKLGGVACFLRDFWIRILALLLPVVLIKRSGKLTIRENSLYLDLAEYSSPGGFRFGWLFRSHSRISQIKVAYTCWCCRH